MRSYKHGDIILVQLEPAETRATSAGTRSGHAVIISGDIINENLQSVIVCPLIDAELVTKSRIGATFVPKADVGLACNSLVFSLQIKTVPKDRILKRISSLPAAYIQQLKESLQTVLELDR